MTSSEKTYTQLYSDKTFDPYDPNLKPLLIDKKLIKNLAIENVSEQTIQALETGSQRFLRLYNSKQLTAPKSFSISQTNQKDLEVHNYTGKCPTNVLELNPAQGSCSISCLYCLVTDGDQVKPMTLLENYPQLVKEQLEKHKGEKVFFYYSPKTEAFSEPLLETGIAHNVLRQFLEHYKKTPDSRARLFIATKAGPKHLNFRNNGESILELLSQLSGKVQLNGSIGIMPSFLHQLLEPNAPSLEERLEAMEMCQKAGVYSQSVLSQPIIPCYLQTNLDGYLSKLKNSNVINIKPEFFTANMGNIAIVSQYINQFDPNSLKDFLEAYITEENQNHVKQRCRTAPKRKLSFDYLNLIHDKAAKQGISTSLCNWVKSETGADKTPIENLAKQRGFLCLGYQEELFKK